MHNEDTIFALATPPAKSGVAIIRISGNEALAALEKITGKADWQPNQAKYCSFNNPSNNELVDRGLALFFAEPHSFTGENTVELQIHGSLAVIKELLDILAKIGGLRPAEAGEFTRRAFTNGKVDLIEAEGLADLIAAETNEQKKLALHQLQGGLSSYYDQLRTQMLSILAHLEAYIDFPDEEIPESALSGLSDEVSSLRKTIATALDDDHKGERVREGLNIVILGAPNAGKSSLINKLARREAAITSHKAGTTRDVIEIQMDIAGFPVTLMDTAGLRNATDDIEEEGVRRALDRAESADLKLIVFDSSASEIDKESRGLIFDNSLIIINKMDISISDALKKQYPDALLISSKTGQGIDELLACIEQEITGLFSSQTAPMITHNRHRSLLANADNHLSLFDSGKAIEINCEELRLAAQSIGKITGKIAVDDVLGEIFSQFCIGK